MRVTAIAPPPAARRRELALLQSERETGASQQGQQVWPRGTKASQAVQSIMSMGFSSLQLGERAQPIQLPDCSASSIIRTVPAWPSISIRSPSWILRVASDLYGEPVTRLESPEQCAAVEEAIGLYTVESAERIGR